MLLRSLVCFPKLLVTIGKQCSSTVLHLLRYVLSLWNASVQKWKRKDLMQDNAGDKSPLRLPSIGGEKDRTVDARVGSATTLCSEDEGSTSTSGGIPDASTPAEGGVSNLQPVVPSSVNANPVEFNSGDYPSLQTLTRQMLPFANPFARVFQSDLVTMLLSLDYPNFIGRSLQSTRVDNETDLDRWNDFWNVFQANIGNISLLATVLLSGNLSFLSIVAQDGLSYLPQRLSYASLFAALGSIFVGLAVRTPSGTRKTHSDFSFGWMVTVLGFPFELFLYSINAATLQIAVAVSIMGFVIISLSLYWLITEPSGERPVPCEGMTRRGQV